MTIDRYGRFGVFCAIACVGFGCFLIGFLMIGGGVALLALNLHHASTAIGMILVGIGICLIIMVASVCMATANRIKNGFDPKEDWWPCV